MLASPSPGHTEYLAERTRAPLPVMMLATKDLRVALATTHLPLQGRERGDHRRFALPRRSKCSHHDLEQWWGISAPRIAVCGLNPHAGESGHLGDEEIRVIAPAIARMRERGMKVTGPMPADTAFVPRSSRNATRCWRCITIRACR